MPRHATEEIQLSIRDFSRGVVGGISERGISKIDFLSAVDNLYGRPVRGMRVRPGSRDLSTAILSDQPHSLMGFYSGGGNKLFVGAAAKIFEVQAGAYALQSLPGGHPATSDIFMHTNLNGLLVATQRGGALTPLTFDGTSWKELKLEKPVAAIGFAADSAIVPPNLGVDVGTHYYRIRWRFTNGSSLAGPVSAAHVVAGPNQTVNINAGLAGSARSDYIGWTLERTKVNAPSSAGPWWFVADGTAAVYADAASDASLGYQVDEGLHHEPPHFDGITAFAGRLWGWAGSGLYASQAIGDLEATGIANFDPDLLFQVAKDDGDTIQTCIVVQKELLILKRRSVHVMSGVDPESFLLESIVYADPSRGSEAGCGGPRAACVIGGVAHFWGESGGLFTYARGSVKPEAWVEMGRYLDELNTPEIDKLLLINHQGNYILAWYPRAADLVAKDQIVLDARLSRWYHWKGWTARDAIELKTGLLSATGGLAFCDPSNRAFFQAISNGATITGAGVPGGTTVSGAVLAGATTLTMSANATATAQNVTLTIAGVATPHCNTTNGSPTVTISEYHVWSAFEGFKDEKAQGGSGGVAPATMWESPWLDSGMPDDFKSLDRVSYSCEGDLTSVTIAVTVDPPGANTALTLATTGAGANWGPDSGSGTNDLEWDTGDWALDSPTTVAAGVKMGTVGRRFKLNVTASPTGDYRPSGIELVAVLLPDKEYNV
jgi:hypothetical protein